MKDYIEWVMLILVGLLILTTGVVVTGAVAFVGYHLIQVLM